MKIEIKSSTGWKIAAFLTLVALTLRGQQLKPQEAQVAVIVNPDNPVDSISQTDLRKIFTGEKQSWNSSLPVFPIVRAPGAWERVVLLGRVMKMSESEYKEYWVKKVYSGEAPHEPLVVMSNGMQLEAVRFEKGGIALISVSDIHQGVKVLKVDGHLPGSEGYPLK